MNLSGQSWAPHYQSGHVTSRCASCINQTAHYAVKHVIVVDASTVTFEYDLSVWRPVVPSVLIKQRFIPCIKWSLIPMQYLPKHIVHCSLLLPCSLPIRNYYQLNYHTVADVGVSYAVNGCGYLTGRVILWCSGTECLISVWQDYKQRRKRRWGRKLLWDVTVFDSVDIASCFLGTGFIVSLASCFINATKVSALPTYTGSWFRYRISKAMYLD